MSRLFFRPNRVNAPHGSGALHLFSESKVYVAIIYSQS